ncbi:GAF domain-containing protein [Leptothermofonsia sichuanensis E412]|uniref:GAF domain-containing protein n=1 Tax=Leptothermofonsia sichuanensis TaxID=2917832 RepID=UPI001CA6BA3B|nr:GAF domain-containing protein [Leptothermofonsia sichuanensis]QZZ22981.1 GAF domain-containing protein [Leptothermofonsia sichuanensis E412]
MNKELLTKLKQCCRDEAAFEQLRQILNAELGHDLEVLKEQARRSQKAAERESSIIRVIGKLGQSIIDRIQQSFNFNDTLHATLEEVRHFLEADRVAVYRFHPDWSGEFISESVGEGWLSLLEEQHKLAGLLRDISECALRTYPIAKDDYIGAGNFTNSSFIDPCVQETQGEILQQRESFVAYDIYNSGFPDCYIETLQQYQVRAYAIVPIYLGKNLWGLLAAYQNSGPRQWQESEVNLLSQVGQQLGAALQLADSIQEAQLQAERRHLIANIADRIREPVDIPTILETTTQETRHLLQADRVAVYRFTEDWNGEFIAEACSEGWVRLVGPDIQTVWEDTYLQETQGGRYRNHENWAVNDIYTAGLTDCHIDLLEQFQAKAFVIAPIFMGTRLWGLLAAYQNTGPRSWQAEEVSLLVQIGVQLGIALQQAELIANLRWEIIERQQAEEQVKQLNLDLQKRNAELSTINQELESFAYSVSHDLRAPLRSIDGFSQAILEDYYEQIDATGQDYLRRIRSATQRMGQLIDDLLALSRVTRSDLKQELVDLSAIALGITSDLRQSAPNRDVQFVIQEGLRVSGDSHLLRVVLVNLLENAWKFTSRKPQARIEFGVVNDTGKKIYFIKDDGAGFDMAYSHKLFGAFQRLHSMADFPGNGIGLATIQRVIHRHGGRVWAEGAVGQGATFYFTLGVGE